MRVLTTTLLLLVLLSLAACDTDSSTCSVGSGSLPPQSFVVARLAFSLATEDDTIEGFDLDHRVSNEPEQASCFQVDQVDALGRAGVDNSLAELFLVVRAFVGNAIDGLIQMAVNDGTLLVMFRLEGLDDVRNDPCVELQMFKGTGPGSPQLATTGFLAPSQTFDVDLGTPISHGSGYVEDGVLYAGPFDAVVPLKFFQVYVNMRLQGAYVRAEITETGGLAHGVLGGGIEIEQVMDVVESAAENDGTAQALLGVAPLALARLADLDYDGTHCNQASAALVFEAEPAFLLGDSAQRAR